MAIWELIRDAVVTLGGKATIPQIEQYFQQHHPEKNIVNIRFDTTMITVNAPSRIHYGGGKKLRFTNTNNPYDCLFKTDNGYYEIYNPEKHGVWEIYKDNNGKYAIRLAQDIQAETVSSQKDADTQETISIDDSKYNQFAFESHLRDFLARNLSTINGLPRELQLYVDDKGNTGIEYRTEVGNIDVLAIDNKKCLYVFELKLGRGSDAAVGQVLRYMGWLRKNVKDIEQVYGVLMASELSDKLKYAASMIPNILLFEYQMQFTIKPAELT